MAASSPEPALLLSVSRRGPWREEASIEAAAVEAAGVPCWCKGDVERTRGRRAGVEAAREPPEPPPEGVREATGEVGGEVGGTREKNDGEPGPAPATPAKSTPHHLQSSVKQPSKAGACGRRPSSWWRRRGETVAPTRGDTRWEVEEAENSGSSSLPPPPARVHVVNHKNGRLSHFTRISLTRISHPHLSFFQSIHKKK